MVKRFIYQLNEDYVSSKPIFHSSLEIAESEQQKRLETTIPLIKEGEEVGEYNNDNLLHSKLIYNFKGGKYFIHKIQLNSDSEQYKLSW